MESDFTDVSNVIITLFIYQNLSTFLTALCEFVHFYIYSVLIYHIGLFK